MGLEKINRQLAVKGLRFEGTSQGTASIDPANAAAGDETVTATFTLTGASTGDLVLMFPPSTLEDDLIPKMAVVTAANTVTVYLYANAVVNGAARTWNYIWFKQS